mmetsp:Transcript_5390/g.12501  ORF Transcript_5390/g.12501 Transcript_5390/m.12501 type:complete len:254 (-) Transcript_5390:100-861(-)
MLLQHAAAGGLRQDDEHGAVQSEQSVPRVLPAGLPLASLLLGLCWARLQRDQPQREGDQQPHPDRLLLFGAHEPPGVAYGVRVREGVCQPDGEVEPPPAPRLLRGRSGPRAEVLSEHPHRDGLHLHQVQYAAPLPQRGRRLLAQPRPQRSPALRQGRARAAGDLLPEDLLRGGPQRLLPLRPLRAAEHLDLRPAGDGPRRGELGGGGGRLGEPRDAWQPAHLGLGGPRLRAWLPHRYTAAPLLCRQGRALQER